MIDDGGFNGFPTSYSSSVGSDPVVECWIYVPEEGLSSEVPMETHQPALTDVQTFVKDNIYSQITTEGGNYLNVGINNVPVYVYKAPYGLPTSHDLPTSVSLNKAFTSTSDVDGYAIPTYPDVYQFTTYIVAFDAVGNVIEDITYTPTYTPVQTERAHTVNISKINTGSSNTSTVVTSGDSTEITVTSTDTADGSSANAYNTGITIDLVNDAGVEYWFDFNHLSATGYYYLVPTIMDPADISGVNTWAISGTTAKYATGQLMMNNTYTAIFNNTTRTGYNGNEDLNSDSGCDYFRTI